MGERTRRQVDGDVADLCADRAAALGFVPVSRETLARLDQYVALLLAWQATTNLIAPSTIPHIWTRHIADSLQLISHAPSTIRLWVDLGSGGGFPAVPIACALAERGEVSIHMVESNAKKCAFLREAIRLTAIRGVVHCERIERFAGRFSEPVDVVSARALAPLPILLGEAAPLLKTGSVGLFPKGQDVEAELTEAAKYWTFDAAIKPSVTAKAGRIVAVRALKPRLALSPGRATSQHQP